MRRLAALTAGLVAVLSPSISGCGWILGLDEYSLNTCLDGVLGEGEEAVDCGGPCVPCADRCVDGVRNGSETDVDCGGASCGPCKDGRGCIVGPDCESLACSAGTCLPPACDDKVTNGQETDRDCGGMCSLACAVGEGCIKGEDCESRVCGDDLACVSNHTWSFAFSSTKFPLTVVAPDASGNVLLAGGFDGSMNFGGDELPTAGKYDAFVAKFASDGKHIWSRKFGDASTQAVRAIAVDPDGNIVVVGEFEGALDLGEGSLTSAGETDIFVAKFDSSGELVWGKRFGDAAFQRPERVAVGPGGGVVVSGSFEGTLNFGGPPLVSAGNEDAFIVSFGPSGDHIWSKRFGDGNFDQVATGVVMDNAGALFVTGFFRGTIDLAGGLTTNSSNDAFIIKFDAASGDVLWGKKFGSSFGHEGGGWVGSLPTGELLLVGAFNEYLDVVGATISTAGGSDIFVLKLTASGDPLWIRGFGSNLNEAPFDVALSPDGRLALGGVFGESIDFGGGPLLSVGNDDLFLAEIDQDGNHIWSRRYGGEPDAGLISSVAFGAPGVLFASGLFTSTVDLGGGSLSSKGDGAIFLAKYLLP
jgi:hypothetical protein